MFKSEEFLNTGLPGLITQSPSELNLYSNIIRKTTNGSFHFKFIYLPACPVENHSDTHHKFREKTTKTLKLTYISNHVSVLKTSYPRMKSATQDRYWPDQLWSRTGGPISMVWEKFGSRFSVWPMEIFVCSVWPISTFRSVWPGQYPHIGLFGVANTQILVCSIWPIHNFLGLEVQPKKSRSSKNGIISCCIYCFSK